MLKAMGKREDGLTLFLGLSHENLIRLAKGEPISSDLKKEDLLGADYIVIFSGKDEAAMQEELIKAAGDIPAHFHQRPKGF